MIKTVKGDLLSLEEGIMVHGCNCHGIMGSGFAKFLRDKWPSVYLAYRHTYESHGLFLGDIVAVRGAKVGDAPAIARHTKAMSRELPEKLVVVNAMTQYDYGRDPERVYVDYDAISAAFARIRLLARDTGLPVHVPLIGCGLANGKWEEVGARIEAALGPDVTTTLWIKD